MRCTLAAASVAAALSSVAAVAVAQAARTYDVVIYGATPAGCSGAVAAASYNASLRIALLESSSWIGGMMVPGGIGLRDTADFESAFGNGSFARRWAAKNGEAYGVDYVLQPDVVVGNASLWWLLGQFPQIEVFTNTALLEGPGAVTKAGAAVSAITTVDPRSPTGGSTTWTAAQFIDASYDGDLVVGAGLSYTYGRESRDTYNESLAGVQPYNTFQNFAIGVNPFDENGNVLPYIEEGQLPPVGSGDTKLMPFSYRACLTKNASNQVPFPQPPGYNASDFRLLQRYLASFPAAKFPNGPSLGDLVGVYTYGGPVPYPTAPGREMKYDMCEGGSGTNDQTSPMTTDQPDINDGYVTADRAGRAEIASKVFYYVAGFMYFLANDPSVPEGTRNSTRAYGLCKDAVPYWGPQAWPTQLYVREGVRLVGEYVATQANIIRGVCEADSIASSAWTIDIHPMRRVALKAADSPLKVDTAYNEGQVGFQHFPGNGSVWEVRYGVIVPKRSEATNVLVPVCASVSHVGYGSFRVEPTFTQIGAAAGSAAALAIQHGVAVQDVPIVELQALQRAQGVEPHYPAGRCPS